MATRAPATKAPMAGWIMFAAIAMLIVGFIDVFEGFIAAIRKEYYALTPQGIIIFDMSTWGWLTLIFGIVLILAGLALWSGASWARWFTIVVASLNVLGQLAFLGQSNSPIWTLTTITLNIIVIYALTVRWTGYPDAYMD
jgi:vacuolar-type H+-ATPase subunit I/STV1